MRIIMEKIASKNLYQHHKGTEGNLFTHRRNINLIREREIEAMVSMAQNILFDRYEDVVSKEIIDKQ